jgi:hypothetical protein
VERVAGIVDERMVHDAEDDHPVFPGWEISGEFALGEGRRVLRAKATVEQVTEWLLLVKENLEKCKSASERKFRRYGLLWPYLESGLNVEDSVAAYVRDHPDNPTGKDVET